MIFGYFAPACNHPVGSGDLSNLRAPHGELDRVYANDIYDVLINRSRTLAETNFQAFRETTRALGWRWISSRSNRSNA